MVVQAITKFERGYFPIAKRKRFYRPIPREALQITLNLQRAIRAFTAIDRGYVPIA